MLITFCLFSESAWNSSIFDLNGVYSVNNTLSPAAVSARLRCVISFVDYLLLCVLKSLFLCVLCVDIYFMCYLSHFLFLYIDVCFFVDFFITQLYSSLLFFKIYSKNHYLLFCRKAFISMCFYTKWLSIHSFHRKVLMKVSCYIIYFSHTRFSDYFLFHCIIFVVYIQH